MKTSTFVTAPDTVGARSDVRVGGGVRGATVVRAGWVLAGAATDDVVLAVEHPDIPIARIKTSAPPGRDMTPQ